jgi:M6 family metalloprotease-like protein
VGASLELECVTPPTLDGKVLGDSGHNGGYAQFGEIHLDHQATIGIMVHELGHDITWPDLYDTDGSSDGVGVWSIMGSGS